MGHWGTEAWENDAAADWFAELFEKSGLANLIESTLQLDSREAADEIRAAAYIILQLGRTYIWPVATLDFHLELTIKRLSELMLATATEPDLREMHEAIKKDVETLKTRLSTRE